MKNNDTSLSKVLLALFGAMIIFSTPSSTQTWTQQIGTGTFYGVSFSDSSNGTIVGAAGSIRRTTNGGTTWTAQTSGTSNQLSAVSFSDSNNGTAVGFSGKILRTTNGGTTWTTQTSGTSLHLWGVSFTDANNGTVVGGSGIKLRTTNGGTTWTSQGATSADLYSVSFTDSSHGTAVGYNGGIRRTTDAGVTWTTQTYSTIYHYMGVSFTDSSHGTAVGFDGVIIRTTNGGANWTAQTSGTSYDLRSVSFVDSNYGVAVGNNGTILRTTDGGANWALGSVFSTTNLYGVSITNRNNGIVVGTSFVNGSVFTSIDATAMPAAVATTTAASSVDMVSAMLNGSVNAKGSSTVVRFLWGTVSGTYTDSIVATQSPLSGTATLSNTNVSVDLTGLNPNTNYYVRVAAENFNSYARGSEVTFKTVASTAPTVSTLAATGMQFDAASLNGTVNTHGASTVVRFLRGTASGVYMDSVTASQSPMLDSTSTTASVVASGLDTGTAYYVRISASNALYYVRGAEISFTTKSIQLPTVAGSAATSIGATIATLNGTLNTHGLYTSVRFLRGTVSGTYTDSVDASQSPVTDSTSNSISAALTGLAPNTTYYVRVAAENPHYYARSTEFTITTLATTASSVTTLPASSVSTVSATVNGSVNTYGSSTVVRFLSGTVSGTYTDSIVATQSPVIGASVSSVSAAFTGLTPNTTYYIKVAANNGTQYVRGNEISFTTYAGIASGSALSFDGEDDYVSFADDDTLDITNEITIEAWAKFNDVGYHWILGKDPVNSSYELFTEGGTFVFRLTIGGILYDAVGGTENPGEWTHLAGTYDGAEMKLYINGDLITTTAISGAIDVTTDPLRIGAFITDGTNYMMNGTLDDVRLWSVARTQQEIRDNMYRNLTGTTHMRAYLKFDEGDGGTTVNTIGNASGVLVNGTAWVTSSAPLGTGTSTSVSGFSTGIATLGSLSITTTEDLDNAADLSGTVLTAAPNSIPSGSTSIVGNKYFIVNAYGNPGGFAADLSIDFGSGVLPSQVNDYPAAVQLYSRGRNSTGQWSLIGGAVSASSSSGVVTWSGITTFGQFAAVVSASPAVTTTAATSVEAHSVKLNGTVNGHGFSTTVRFLYGTTSGTYTDSITASQSPLSDTETITVSANINSLSANTQYFVKTIALNSYSYVAGSELSFTTAMPESSGYALTFDGVDDYVTIADTSTLDITTSITLEAWVKFNSIGHHWIVGKDPYNTAYQLFADTYSGDKFYFQINTDAQASGGTRTVGVWTHVAGTYDGANLKLYINGELIATTPYTNPIAATSGPLKFGAFDYLGNPWYPMDGSIEEVRIWNVARTQQQIRENMHRVQSTQGNLVVYFKFNEGTGSATTGTFDAYTASLVNNPSWIVSTAPFGTGTSSSTASPMTEGTANLGSAAVTLSESFDNAVHLTSTEIYVKPYSLPVGYTSAIANKYFIINAFGTPGTFSANITVNYGAGVLDSRVTSFPGGMKLYKRSTFGDGAWTLVGGAASASATTGVVTWNGVTSFSQFAAVYEESALPVELVSFAVTAQRLNAELKWSTATEVNNYGFEVEKTRRQNTEEGSQKSEVRWEKIGFVEGNGTTNAPLEYSFMDKNIAAGKYSYRLKQIDHDGNFGYSQSIEVEVGTVPKIFAMEQNYPNPFNPSTTIGFTLQVSGMTSLKIYDVIGREVTALVNEELEAGVYHQRTFDASKLSSGIYFARLISGNNVQVKKLLLMR